MYKTLLAVVLVLLIALLAVTAAMAAYPPTAKGIAITTTTWSAAAPTMAASNKSAPWSTLQAVKKSDGMGAVESMAVLQHEQISALTTTAPWHTGLKAAAVSTVAPTDIGTTLAAVYLQAAPDTPTSKMAITGTFVGMGFTKAVTDAAPAPTKLVVPGTVALTTFPVASAAGSVC
ncbi:MAG: hypothetical protein WCP91_01725 [Candidatus Berkelbacteria bacterium]